jgi:hypothetical protein
MSIQRQLNVLGQMRVDVPHLRSIESSIAYDFDTLAGKALSGKIPLVLKGFTVSTSGTVGTPATGLQLNVAGGLLMHFGASEAGTVFTVADNAAPEILSATNRNVSGSFVGGVTNYIGLDLLRSADSSTSDITQFLDTGTLKEKSQSVPQARTLQYKIVISTQNFTVSSNILPIAQVVTDGLNNVGSVTDCRRMMFRLGSGGDSPSALSSYNWGARTENPIIYSGGLDAFTGEDKSITNLKSWMDATMTSIWELRGGQSWYSNVFRDNVKLCYGPSVVAANGDNFYFNAGTLYWKGLSLAFENSVGHVDTITDNDITGVAFADGSCLYVDLVRESNATIVAHVGTLAAVGSSLIPGRRIILAWRLGSYVYSRDRSYEVGRTFSAATTVALGLVRINAVAPVPAAPVVPVILANGQIELVATGGNSWAFKGTGDIRGPGGYFTGGAGTGGAGGVGVDGFGGAATAASGNGGGAGGVFTGGLGDGAGVDGAGLGAISRNGIAATFTNSGTGPAIVAGGITNISSYITNPALLGRGTSLFKAVDNYYSIMVLGAGTAPAAVFAHGSSTAGIVAQHAIWAKSNGAATVRIENDAAIAVNALEVVGNGVAGAYGASITNTGATNYAGSIVGSGGAEGLRAVGTNYAVNAIAGDVGVSTSNKFKYTGTQTGVIIIPAIDFKATIDLVFSDVVPGGGYMAGAYYTVPANKGARFKCVVRIPRGARLTNCDIWIRDGGAGAGQPSMANPDIHQFKFDATQASGVNKYTILTGGTIAVPLNGYAWYATGALTTGATTDGALGATGDNNSSWIEVDWAVYATLASGFSFGGMKFRYDFTEVDFMV